MINAELVAKYFLNKDDDRKIFNKNFTNIRGKDCYEGNVKLNKYLHISQLLYFTKYDKKLFKDDLYAYHNGAIVKDVQSRFSTLYSEHDDVQLEDSRIKCFLDKIYDCFKNATIDDLIEISHEDPAWLEQEEKIYSNAKMNLEKYKRQYKQQYKDILEAMDL
ncbi:MAG: SocA family protein [Bacilli bacterium]|nr:SocA family protein [Bacilli bacterium]